MTSCDESTNGYKRMLQLLGLCLLLLLCLYRLVFRKSEAYPLRELHELLRALTDALRLAVLEVLRSEALSWRSKKI
jgi:hypothetical protein